MALTKLRGAHGVAPLQFAVMRISFPSGLLTIPRGQTHLVTEEIQKEQRTDSTTAAIAGAPRSHNVWRDAHTFLSDYF